MTDKSLGTFINPFTDFGFNLAKLANMSHEDRHAYEMSLKYYRDFINVLDTAKKETRLARDLEIAKTMLEEGFDIKTISKITGLANEVITTL